MRISNLKILLSCSLITAFIIIYNYKLIKIDRELPNIQPVNDTKYILYWTPFWRFKDFAIGLGAKPFKTCEYKNCFTTNNRALKPIETFEAIIFHGSIYSPKNHGAPHRRNERQVYIFCNLEAPANLAPNFTQFNSFYNWTMTYRFDSDIVARYGKFIEKKSHYTLPSVEVIQNKTKLVAWFVSHCETSSKRERLASEMQKFLPVDIYGKCGPLKCQQQKSFASSPKCDNMLEKNYKFYLSFENSICKDYSTEKLYNFLTKNIIPIVYGAGNYSLSAPPNSVIDVTDFVSVEQLTNYIKYLDKNVTEYLKYFEWRKRYKIVHTSQVCDLCKKLNQPIRKSVYHDLHGWAWGKSNDICKTGEKIPNIVKNIL